MQETLEKLKTKAKFCEEQMECYNVYVKSCLDRLGKMGRLVAGVDDQSSEIYTLGVVVL